MTARSHQKAEVGQSLEVTERDRAVHAGDLRHLVDGVGAAVSEKREQDGAPRRVACSSNQAVELRFRVRVHLG